MLSDAGALHSIQNHMFPKALLAMELLQHDSAYVTTIRTVTA